MAAQDDAFPRAALADSEEDALRILAGGGACVYLPFLEFREAPSPDGGFVRTYGDRYRGTFDEDDGCFVEAAVAPTGDVRIRRDGFGSVPLYYSKALKLVTTELGLARALNPRVNVEAAAEYVASALNPSGMTVWGDVRALLPNQRLTIEGGAVKVAFFDPFPDRTTLGAEDFQALFAEAVDRALRRPRLSQAPRLAMNLSGGNDSSLIAARLRALHPAMEIRSTTFYHSDWRTDFDDYRYAQPAAERFGFDHRLVLIDNETFAAGYADLAARTKRPHHTYAVSFHLQNRVLDEGFPLLINGSGPDESMIGTEKVPIADLLAIEGTDPADWVDRVLFNRDYLKLSPEDVAPLFDAPVGDFLEERRALARSLVDCDGYAEFQRRFHTLTILQDHIKELSAVAGASGKRLVFPFLTNDVFRLVFMTPIAELNRGGVYKFCVKRILEKHFPSEFVHRPKVGFQAPSRPYFQQERGLGRLLRDRLAAKAWPSFLNRPAAERALRERISGTVDTRHRYDFAEWCLFNLLAVFAEGADA